MTTPMNYSLNSQSNTRPSNASIIFSSYAQKLFTSIFNGDAYRESFVLLGGQRDGESLFIDAVSLVPNRSRATHRLRISHAHLAERLASLSAPLVATAHSHSEMPTPSAADSNVFCCFPKSIVHLIVRPMGESICLSAYQFLGQYMMPRAAHAGSLDPVNQEKAVTPHMKKEHIL